MGDLFNHIMEVVVLKHSSGKVEATNVAAYVDEKSNYLATAFSASNGGTLTLNNCHQTAKAMASMF